MHPSTLTTGVARRTARRRRLVALSAVALAVVVARPAPLEAHAELRRSSPAANARLTAPPALLEFWFSEAIERSLSRVILLGPTGDTVALAAFERRDDAQDLAVPVTGRMVPGRYRIRWGVTARDGHPSSGEFSFDLAAGVVATESAATTRPPTVADGQSADSVGLPANAAAVSLESPVLVAGRWVGFVALFLAIGAGLFRALIVPRVVASHPELGDAARDAFRRAGAIAVGAALALVAADLVRLAGEALSVSTDGRVHLTTLLLSTTWGWAWLVEVAGAVLVAVVYPRVREMRPRGSPVLLLGAVAMVAGTAASGHAVSGAFPLLTVVIDAAHVLAAAGWLGMLALVLFAGLPAARGRAGAAPAFVNAFSPLALWCVVGAGLSGVIMAWVHLGGLTPLWHATYGRALLLKLGLLSLAAGLGAYNWRVVRPTLGGDPATLRRTAGSELALACLVLAVTAVLVALPPPATMPHESPPAAAGRP